MNVERDQRYAGLDFARLIGGALLAVCVAASGLLDPNTSAAAASLAGLLARALAPLTAFFFVAAGAGFALRYGNRDVELGPYWTQRALRVLPLFVVFLFFRAYVGRNDFSFVAFVDSLITLDYLPSGLAHRESLAAPGWLLGPMLQAYIVFPFFHRFVRTEGIRWSIGSVAVVSLGRWIALNAGTTHIELSTWTALGRLDQVFLGYFVGRIFLGSKRTRALVCAAGAVAIGVAGLSCHRFAVAAPGWLTAHRAVRPLFLGLVLCGVVLLVLSLAASLSGHRASRGIHSMYGAHLFFLPVIDAINNGHWLWPFRFQAPTNALLNAIFVATPAAALIGWMAHGSLAKPLEMFLARTCARGSDSASAIAFEAAAPTASDQ